jgi:hypothetical protein
MLQAKLIPTKCHIELTNISFYLKTHHSIKIELFALFLNTLILYFCHPINDFDVRVQCIQISTLLCHRIEL